VVCDEEDVIPLIMSALAPSELDDGVGMSFLACAICSISVMIA